MLYDLSNPLHAEQFKLRVNKLYQSKAVVELTEKKTKRSLLQNKYLHLILGYFGVETGNTLDWVKREYFKKLCNKDIFVKERVDNITNQKVLYLRSSADLTTDEMTTALSVSVIGHRKKQAFIFQVLTNKIYSSLQKLKRNGINNTYEISTPQLPIRSV